MFIELDKGLINLDYVVRIYVKKSGETVQVNALLDDYETEWTGYISIDEWDDLRYAIMRDV